MSIKTKISNSKTWTLIEFGQFVERSSAKYDPINSDVSFHCIELEHLDQQTGRLLGYVDSKEQASIKNKFSKGDVLFGKLRPYLKKFYLAEFDGVCSSEIWVLRGIEGVCESTFLYYLVQQHRFIETCNKTTGSKMPRAEWELVSEEPFPIPSLDEQKKIAKILSTWDKLIEKQTKLIAAKEKRKKALTQVLLTGQVRFREFKKKEWIEVPLSEAAWYQEGPGLRTFQFKKSGIKVINITNIVNGFLDLSKTDRHISLEEFNKTYKHFAVDDRDIVVASSGNSYCKHGIVRAKDLPLVMNTSVIRFKPQKGCDYDFLNQFLKSPLLKNQIDILITGGAQPNFGPAHLEEIIMPFPELEEQRKIAITLHACDREIDFLKRELEGSCDQKKGLMQQLLTGKMRVKI